MCGYLLDISIYMVIVLVLIIILLCTVPLQKPIPSIDVYLLIHDSMNIHTNVQYLCTYLYIYVHIKFDYFIFKLANKNNQASEETSQYIFKHIERLTNVEFAVLYKCVENVLAKSHLLQSSSYLKGEHYLLTVVLKVSTHSFSQFSNEYLRFLSNCIGNQIFNIRNIECDTGSRK